MFWWVYSPLTWARDLSLGSCAPECITGFIEVSFVGQVTTFRNSAWPKTKFTSQAACLHFIVLSSLTDDSTRRVMTQLSWTQTRSRKRPCVVILSVCNLSEWYKSLCACCKRQSSAVTILMSIMCWTSSLNHLLIFFAKCELLLPSNFHYRLCCPGGMEGGADFKVLQTLLWSISIPSLQNHLKTHPLSVPLFHYSCQL